jgi:hypothetical protein
MKTDKSKDKKPVARDSSYAGGSILSSTRFAVISATMMLFEMSLMGSDTDQVTE